MFTSRFVKCYWSQILTKHDFFSKNNYNFMKIYRVGFKLFHADTDRWTDGRTDIMKLVDVCDKFK
jgi:hypothetical protein